MYLDTCVLAKLFIREPDSEECINRVSGSVIVTSELVYGELFSAMLRKERNREISATIRASLWTEFERQVSDERIYLARLDGPIMRQAREVMQAVHPQVPLRTLDAIHLATYLSVITGPLFTKDKRMKEAARFLNIPLID